LRKVISRRTSVFRLSLGRDPPAKVEPVRVVLEAGAAPVKATPRDYKPEHRSWLSGLWLSWSSSAMPVPKPGSRGYRLVADYRAVNSRTKRNPFPMPNMEPMMAAITGAGCFPKLDLFKGYWQFPLSGPGQEIYTLVTSEGLYSPMRVPQGVLTATAPFQARITAVLEGLLTKICLLWVDIIVWGEDAEDLVHNLDGVLGRLEERHFCCRRRVGVLYP
ncbi:unnamed protein product, partial [Discosporangium mesarthrocarpum]